MTTKTYLFDATGDLNINNFDKINKNEISMEYTANGDLQVENDEKIIDNNHEYKFDKLKIDDKNPIGYSIYGDLSTFQDGEEYLLHDITGYNNDMKKKSKPKKLNKSKDENIKGIVYNKVGCPIDTIEEE